MTHAIENFFTAWGETDATARAAALRAAVSPTLYYVDPRVSDPITTLDALIDYVAMYSQYAPGATAAVVDLSHTAGHARATVAFGMADGSQQLGQYFIELDDQSRATRMIGFVGLGEPQ